MALKISDPRYEPADYSHVLNVARRNPLLVRHLGHIRQRLDDERLGFVLGAGVSEQAGVPLWRDLIVRLFEHYGADGPPSSYKEPNYPATLVAQFIYNRFQIENTKKQHQSNPAPVDSRVIPIAVRNNWYRKIHDALYQDVPDMAEVATNHPYLVELAHMVHKSPFCLSLNFDDITDRIAQAIRTKDDGRQMPNVIWQTPIIERPNSGVIYHVNGFLPQDKGAKRSENIILTEDSFASLLASPSPIETEYLMSRVVSNTMLVVGASFDDPSLRNLFYVAARRNPAGFHYCFQHDEDVNSENHNSDERQDRFALNKNMYNIITYFLTKQEICSLVRLLNATQNTFLEAINEISTELKVHSTYRYYVVGSVSSGKSSLVERLRSFKTYEEWGAAPLEEMFRDPESLTTEERTKVDDWVLSQLVHKDRTLSKPTYGIHIMDRAPLDMFAFSKSATENQTKAKKLRAKLNKDVQGGEIIFLQAEGAVLFERQLRRGRGPEWLSEAAYNKAALGQQTQLLEDVYSPEAKLDTTHLSQDDVARDVVERILFQNFRPADLEAARSKYAESEV